MTQKPDNPQALIKQYGDELGALKSNMLMAQSFASRLRVFAEHIIEYKVTGEEHWHCFGKSYKNIYLQWGINRGYFKSGTSRYITNYEGEHSGFYFQIYVNCYAIFDEHQEFGLYEVTKGLDIFFIDRMNSTFYVTDENIEPLLETLNTWCIDAFEKLKVYRAQERIARLEKELAKSKAIVTEATHD